jgi:hypothetical protein
VTTNTWIRQAYSGTHWSNGQQQWLLASLPAGATLMRARFAWGFGGTTSTSVPVPFWQTQPLAFGLVTTVGNGSELPPDPIISSGDQAPPMQRWLWLEQRVPTVAAWDAAGRTIVWQSSPPQEPTDAHGQVLAESSIGAGNYVDVWATYRAANAWPAGGDCRIWSYFNLLIRNY